MNETNMEGDGQSEVKDRMEGDVLYNQGRGSAPIL